MAYGDKDNGTLYLNEVQINLKNIQDNEEEIIHKFWELEIKKCEFVKEQREQKKEEFQIAKAEDEKRKAIAEA